MLRYYVYLTLFLVFFLGSQAFDSYWIGAGCVVLVIVVPGLVYLCRPSVQEGFRLLLTLFAGNRALARGAYDEAEAKFRELLKDSERMPRTRAQIRGTALCQLAEVYRARGEYSDAELLLLQAVKHYEEATPYRPVQRATALLNLATVWINQGRYAEAEPVCREVLTVFVNARHVYRNFTHNNLGQALAGLGRYDEAENMFRHGLELAGSQIERSDPIGCILLSNLADLLRRQGRVAEAEPLARRAVALVEKAKSEQWTYVRFFHVLAEITRTQGKLDEAETLCCRSQSLIEQKFGPEHIALAASISCLARIRVAQGRLSEAEELYRRCLVIQEGVLAPENRDAIARMEEYATLLQQLSRPAEAEAWLAKVRSIPVPALVKPAVHE